MTLEQLLDELNETDVDSEMKTLSSAISDMESCETRSDFVENLNTAIQSAGMILVELKKIKKTIASRGLSD